MSLEVSPLFADDAASTLDQARALYGRAGRPNLFIKIPGTTAGLPAIEAAVFAGVPINVTLLFSREHYLAVAGGYLRAVERRIAAGLDPGVSSVASVFVSRWDPQPLLWASTGTKDPEASDVLYVEVFVASWEDLMNRLIHQARRPRRGAT